MNEPTPRPLRKLTSLELAAPARGALRRLKAQFGMSYTHAVERGLALVERSFVLGEPHTDAERALLGLVTGPRRANRKKGGEV